MKKHKNKLFIFIHIFFVFQHFLSSRLFYKNIDFFMQK